MSLGWHNTGPEPLQTGGLSSQGGSGAGGSGTWAATFAKSHHVTPLLQFQPDQS